MKDGLALIRAIEHIKELEDHRSSLLKYVKERLGGGKTPKQILGELFTSFDAGLKEETTVDDAVETIGTIPWEKLKPQLRRFAIAEQNITYDLMDKLAHAENDEEREQMIEEWSRESARRERRAARRWGTAAIKGHLKTIGLSLSFSGLMALWRAYHHMLIATSEPVALYETVYKAPKKPQPMGKRQFGVDPISSALVTAGARTTALIAGPETVAATAADKFEKAYSLTHNWAPEGYTRTEQAYTAGAVMMGMLALSRVTGTPAGTIMRAVMGYNALDTVARQFAYEQIADAEAAIAPYLDWFEQDLVKEYEEAIANWNDIIEVYKDEVLSLEIALQSASEKDRADIEQTLEDYRTGIALYYEYVAEYEDVLKDDEKIRARQFSLRRILGGALGTLQRGAGVFAMFDAVKKWGLWAAHFF